MEQPKPKKENPVISQLIELQKVDSELHKLECLKAQKPFALKAEEDAVEKKKEKAKQHADLLKDLRKKYALLELELKEHEEQITKLGAQQLSLKSNKDFQTMQHEIEAVKADNSLREDSLLQSLSSIEKEDAAGAVIKKELAESEKNLEDKKVVVHREMAEIDAQIAEVAKSRKALEGGVPADVLSAYEKILHNKEDRVAIVCVDESSACSACFMTVTSQEVNKLMMNKGLSFCRSCSRIIYLGV